MKDKGKPLPGVEYSITGGPGQPRSAGEGASPKRVLAPGAENLRLGHRGCHDYPVYALWNTIR